MGSNVQYVNRTIDDEFGDELTGRRVMYSPSSGTYWSQGSTCDHCSFKADTSLAHSGTWHDGSRLPENDPEPLKFTFQFNGTAVYIYNILIKKVLTDVNITVDGALAGHYYNNPDIVDQYRYNELIFASNSMSYGEHTVEVSAFGSEHTVVFFDYAVYTTTVEDTSSPPPPPAPISTGVSSTEPAVSTQAPVSSPSDASPSPSGSSDISSFSSTALTSIPSSTGYTSPSSSLLSTNDPTHTATVVSVSVSGAISTVTALSGGNSNLDSSTANHKTNIGPIIGGVIGGVGVFLLSLLLGLVWLIRWRKRYRKGEEITPHTALIEKAEQSVFRPQRRSIMSVVTARRPSQNLNVRTDFPMAPLSDAQSSYGGSTTSSETAAMREAIESLRQQVNSVRMSEKSGYPPRSQLAPSSSSPQPFAPSRETMYTNFSSATAATNPGVATEIMSLRAEINQLRARQDQTTDITSPLSPEHNNQDLLREIALLRSEIEEMRVVQDLGMSPLPSYSPPPPSHPLSEMYGSNRS